MHSLLSQQNKSQRNFDYTAEDRSLKLQGLIDSMSSLRQVCSSFFMALLTFDLFIHYLFCNIWLSTFLDVFTMSMQGALARKRSNFEPNHFLVATEAARKVASNPFHGRAFHHDGVAEPDEPRYDFMLVTFSFPCQKASIDMEPISKVPSMNRRAQTFSLLASSSEQVK